MYGCPFKLRPSPARARARPIAMHRKCVPWKVQNKAAGRPTLSCVYEDMGAADENDQGWQSHGYPPVEAVRNCFCPWRGLLTKGWQH